MEPSVVESLQFDTPTTMNVSLLLTTTTIRLALLCYVASCLIWLLRSERSWHDRVALKIWSVGCIFFFAHMLCGFHHHDWSHVKVYDYTAQQTRDLIGWEFGAGVYFNYLFAAIWCADVARRIWWPCSAVSRGIGVGVHCYMAFIAFNGTVIFKSGIIRYAGMSMFVVLGVLGCQQWLTRQRKASDV